MNDAKYMLDTDAVSFALRDEACGVATRLRRCSPAEVCVSAMTVAELRYGVERRKSAKLAKLVDDFLAPLHIAPFESTAARVYGKVLAQLQLAGQAIGPMDTLIAAHAIALGLTLVTHNVKHFSRVRKLRHEDWM